jgi:uncharacterized membrane protein YhaH (DUF805 family)
MFKSWQPLFTSLPNSILSINKLLAHILRPAACFAFYLLEMLSFAILQAQNKKGIDTNTFRFK